MPRPESFRVWETIPGSQFLVADHFATFYVQIRPHSTCGCRVALGGAQCAHVREAKRVAERDQEHDFDPGFWRRRLDEIEGMRKKWPHQRSLTEALAIVRAAHTAPILDEEGRDLMEGRLLTDPSLGVADWEDLAEWGHSDLALVLLPRHPVILRDPDVIRRFLRGNGSHPLAVERLFRSLEENQFTSWWHELIEINPVSAANLYWKTAQRLPWHLLQIEDVERLAQTGDRWARRVAQVMAQLVLDPQLNEENGTGI